MRLLFCFVVFLFLFEDCLQRVVAEVAAADEPFVSLKGGWMSSSGCSCGSLLIVGDGGAEISFGAWCAPGLVAAAPASQIVRGLSDGQTNGGACRDIGGSARGAPLEGFVACEDVPAGDQDLAR